MPTKSNQNCAGEKKDDLIKAQTDYLFNQLKEFIDWSGDVNQAKDIRHIIFKCLKVNYKEYATKQ